MTDKAPVQLWVKMEAQVTMQTTGEQMVTPSQAWVQATKMLQQQLMNNRVLSKT